MATMTLSITGQNVGTYEKSYEVDDSDAGHILQAWGVRTGKSDPQDIVSAIAEEFLNHVLRETQQYRKDKAAEEAAAAIPDIAVRQLGGNV